MCQLAQVSRAGFYRSLQRSQPVEEAMLVRAEIQQIVLAHRRRYGYRRVTAELRRRGLLVNHKRVARLMREDNLLAVQPRAFVVTTDRFRFDLQRRHGMSQFLQVIGCDRFGVVLQLERPAEIESLSRPAGCLIKVVFLLEQRRG